MINRKRTVRRRRKTVNKTATDKAMSERLCRRLVIHRAQGTCERCGGQGEHWAHNFGRRYSAVRCHEDNAWWLCPPCHRLIDTDPAEKTRLAEVTIGLERHTELRQLAVVGPPTSYTLWWRQERARLTARCEELGISTKWNTPT